MAMRDAAHFYEGLLDITTCPMSSGAFINCSISVFVYAGEFNAQYGAAS